MPRSIKYTNNTYLDSTGIVHNKEKLSNILNNLNKIKVVQLRTPSSDSGVISNYTGTTNILGFQVYAYGQWRSGAEAGTLVFANNGTVYYIASASQISQYLDKPIRIYYI